VKKVINENLMKGMKIILFYFVLGSLLARELPTIKLYVVYFY